MLSKNQIRLLQRCVHGARHRMADPQGTTLNDELVEVLPHLRQAAESLIDMGLLTTDMPSWSDVHTNTHVRLPNLEELEVLGFSHPCPEE